MKKKFGLILAGLLLAPVVFAEETAPTVDAPAPAELSRFSLGMHLSYWNVDDLDNFDGEGAFGLGVIGQYRLHDLLGIELRGSGFFASRYEDVFVAGEGWSENTTTLSILPLEAGLVAFLPLGNTFSLYGGPGAGYYFIDGEFMSEQGPWTRYYDADLDDDFGFYALLGARAQLARNIALYLEGKYTWVETAFEREADFLGIAQELDLSGIAFDAGMLFTF